MPGPESGSGNGSDPPPPGGPDAATQTPAQQGNAVNPNATTTGREMRGDTVWVVGG